MTTELDTDPANVFGDEVKGYSLTTRKEDFVGGGDFRRHVLVDVIRDGSISEDAFAVKKKFFSELNKGGLDDVKVSTVRSMGYDDHSPVAVVYPDGVWYGQLTVEDVPTIIKQHLVDDTPVEDLRFDPEFPEDFTHVIVCTFLSQCGPEGGGKALGYLKKQARDADNIQVTQSYGCLKECSMGPVCCSYPKGDWYPNVDESKFDDVWEAIQTGDEPSVFSAGRIADE
jgi:(2Fe-2S) ferredoxin